MTNKEIVNMIIAELEVTHKITVYERQVLKKTLYAVLKSGEISLDMDNHLAIVNEILLDIRDSVCVESENVTCKKKENR